MMTVSMIVAAGKNRAIGKDNQILWHIPEDFKYFKRITMGKPMIMGRKTFESIGRPLPGRLNIVVTRDATWSADGVSVVHSLDDAFVLAEGEGTEEIFVVGGRTLYEQAMDRADRLYVTEVHRTYEADAFFPEINPSVFCETTREDHAGDPDYSFVVFERT